MTPNIFISQRFLFRSKYDSSYATFTPTLAYFLWYLVAAYCRNSIKGEIYLGISLESIELETVVTELVCTSTGNALYLPGIRYSTAGIGIFWSVLLRVVYRFGILV